MWELFCIELLGKSSGLTDKFVSHENFVKAPKIDESTEGQKSGLKCFLQKLFSRQQDPV